MLYTFYTQEKKKGKDIYATYFLSGFAHPKNFSQEKDKKKGASKEDVQESTVESDQHFILLCPCSKLEETKEKFNKLLSVHIYAISPSPIHDFQELTNSDKILSASSSNGKTLFE